MKKQLAPADVRSFKEQLTLRRDNLDTTNGWILLDGDKVIISQQRSGHDRTGKVELPAEEFKKFAEWYLRPQQIKAKRS